jgi:hypothetical protein
VVKILPCISGTACMYRKKNQHFYLLSILPIRKKAKRFEKATSKLHVLEDFNSGFFSSNCFKIFVKDVTIFANYTQKMSLKNRQNYLLNRKLTPRPTNQMKTFHFPRHKYISQPPFSHNLPLILLV